MTEKSGGAGGADRPADEEIAEAVDSAADDLQGPDLTKPDLTKEPAGVTDDPDAAAAAEAVEEAEDEDAEDAEAAEARPVTASARATAGSARAAARRSGVRSGVTERKSAPTRSREAATTQKVGLLSKFGRFVREVVSELRKTIWPARSEMVTYTIVVIVFVVFMIALVAGLDLLFAQGVLAIFG